MTQKTCLQKCGFAKLEGGNENTLRHADTVAGHSSTMLTNQARNDGKRDTSLVGTNQPTRPQLDWGSRSRGHLVIEPGRNAVIEPGRNAVIERRSAIEAEPSRNADYCSRRSSFAFLQKNSSRFFRVSMSGLIFLDFSPSKRDMLYSVLSRVSGSGTLWYSGKSQIFSFRESNINSSQKSCETCFFRKSILFPFFSMSHDASKNTFSLIRYKLK